MDEYDRGFDPEVRHLFKRIINSFSWGALWLIGIASLGIFFKLGFVGDGVRWYNVLYYLILIASLFALLRYLYRTWK